jgi:hypothetical protein
MRRENPPPSTYEGMFVETVLSPRMYFSYGQFMVYDIDVISPWYAWTEGHYAQGFARRDSAVCFGSILDFGHADVTFVLGGYQPAQRFERVIAVPFTVVTGRVAVKGPEEFDIDRLIELPRGYYCLTAAQQMLSDDLEDVHLFFESVAERQQVSSILVEDELLSPSYPLLETVEIAGCEE